MYAKALKLLTSAGRFRIELGLKRITAVLKLLGNPQDRLKCIHVAGTNGKGSVCAMLAAVLREAGMKTGLYTSPHIYDYTERIKINGADIPREEFTRLVFEICALADKNDIALTEFEILSAVMFKYFADSAVDVVVLETGLGGRFDATNVIKSNLCAIITHIDYDHTERLGATLGEITREKEGIIKPNCPVVRLPQPAPAIPPPLQGPHQRENLSLVLAALEKIFPQIPPAAIQAGLAKTKHPARFQLVNENLIVDACHNPNGAAALRAGLDLHFPDRQRRFIFGCLQNKDYKKMAAALFRPEDEICFHEFKNSLTFKEFAQTYPQSTCSRSSVALLRCSEDMFVQTPDDKLNIVCGSIYMINEIVPKEVLFQIN